MCRLSVIICLLMQNILSAWTEKNTDFISYTLNGPERWGRIRIHNSSHDTTFSFISLQNAKTFKVSRQAHKLLLITAITKIHVSSFSIRLARNLIFSLLVCITRSTCLNLCKMAVIRRGKINITDKFTFFSQ